ncbi:hypothetical protein MP638_000916 [Amoeboaphelidium occidentale]|nr:hypothetical protein MP638_000916 [Amoeboaphelidium occidentale]
MVAEEQKKKVNPVVHFMAGGIGGTIGAVITCPLEVVKTRMQSSLYRSESHNGLMIMIKNIYQSEGIKGLWRGLGPNLVGVIPSRAIYFSSYATAKEYYSKTFNNGVESTSVHLVSAATAGVAVSTITNPIWLVKTRMQMQKNSSSIMRDSIEMKTPIMSKQTSSTARNISFDTQSLNEAKRHSRPSPIKEKLQARSITSAQTGSSNLPYYKNSLDCLKQIVKQEGVIGLFRGMGASYLGIIEGTVQWTTYENLKRWIKDYRSSQQYLDSTKQNLQSFDYFFTAAGAKFISAVVSYPHEVLRTRLRQVVTSSEVVNGQTVIISKPVYYSFKDVFKRVVKEEGILAFYGGMTAHLLRTVPNAAIMFLCYETVVSFFDE